MRSWFSGAVFIAVLFTLSSPISADMTKDDIAAALKKDLKHPYLHFTEQDKPAILDRIESDTACSEIMRREIAEANRLIHTPIDRDAPERHTNARFEGDYQYESFLMRNAEAAYRLAFVYQMTGEERYARKAFEFADVLCDQPTWIHSAHEFPDIYDRVWPWGSEDDHPAFGYSQHTDHFVFRMAAVYDWLYPVLSLRERDRIRGALLEKAILRVRGNYEYHWWASAYRCNWCAVCNSSLGVAAIALLTEDPNLVDVIAESWNRISKTLDEIKTGGWQEGMGYLVYTVRTSLTFADVLKRASGGGLNLYKHPRFGDAVTTFLYCQIPPGRSVHFGDSGGGRIGSYRMFNDLMLETGDTRASWLGKHLSMETPTAFADIFKPTCTLEPSIPDEPSILFPSVNWAILRSDFTDTDKVVIAAKCGINDDPHHGHLDAGHFSLYWRGCEFVCDHGSAGYDKAYFDDARWDYPLATTGGHNCVMVNGVQQLPCKRKNKPWDMRYGGEIVEFRPGEKRDYVLMNPTNAYPRGTLTSWRRHIVLDKPVVAVVLDEVSCGQGAEIEARFHSAASQRVRDGFVVFEHSGDRMALITASTADIGLREGSHTILLAQRNARMRRVHYVGAVAAAKEGRTVIASVILPVGDENEAESVAKSLRLTGDGGGDVTLSFRKGRRFSYRFAMGEKGLVLE